MRASILTLVSLGTLLAFTGCDVDTDDALQDGDDVSFRCLSGCFQSPHVGLFDISNMNETKNSTATSADGALTVRWTNIVKNNITYLELRVTDLAKCEVRQSNTANWEGCEGAYIDLLITRGSLTTAAKIEVESLATDSSGALNVYKYIVKGNLDPVDGSPETHTIHEVCPEGGDGTRAVVMLPNVQATWADTSAHDGLGELVLSTSNKFSLACDGYAQAKGYTRARVLPATGGARYYGVANYNAITHAMRALFRRPGTTDQYDALTEHGTAIAIKDELNNPPLFDELDQSPPVIGYGEYLLESVYNGQSSVQGGRKGATCNKPYPGVPCGSGGVEFPDGIHRRPEYSPPMVEISGWDDLPECQLSNLDDFGAVGVYEWYEGPCIAQW